MDEEVEETGNGEDKIEEGVNERWSMSQTNWRKKHWKQHFKVVIDESRDEDENLPSLLSAAENTDKMAAAMLSATLSLSVWLLLLVHL